RIDESSEQDITDAVAHNMRLLGEAGVHVDRMHRISAKAAFKGDLVGSGVAGLMEEISSFLADNKGKVLGARFVSRVISCVAPLSNAIDVQVASRSKSVGELDTELATLRQKKLTIEAERGFAEREFTNAWSKAVDTYESGLKHAKAEATTAI